MNTVSRHPARSLGPASAPARRGSQALLACALVVAVALMSFYVHVLNDQVSRGERTRHSQRGGPSDKAMAQTPGASETALMQVSQILPH